MGAWVSEGSTEYDVKILFTKKPTRHGSKKKKTEFYEARGGWKAEIEIGVSQVTECAEWQQELGNELVREVMKSEEWKRLKLESLGT